MKYIDQVTEVISILHNLKHSGTLPKELEKYRGWIETFDSNKLKKQMKVRKLNNEKVFTTKPGIIGGAGDCMTDEIKPTEIKIKPKKIN